ncbi:Lrp/AsnC ligand binding domain-containing protein [Inquilinus sp. CA228]|uniref:Lrp/AsnC ligand binding domain-containing protein n=1 Tax=Inquilinus sp. CA228 TaxID=3455609 RepID=UPI003F8D7501
MAAIGIIAFVQITLDHRTEEYLARFERAVRQCPEVDQCYLMAGTPDYLLRVVARDMADYARIHKEQLSRMPGVSHIQSALTLRSMNRGNYE